MDDTNDDEQPDDPVHVSVAMREAMIEILRRVREREETRKRECDLAAKA